MIPYRIALVTDLHIDDKDKMNYNIDSKSNFSLILDDIKMNKIHHLIITGDLCNLTPKISIYKWIKEKLEEYDFTYNIVPGNHDRIEMIKEVFGIKDIVQGLNEWGKRVIFLDTSSNKIYEDQLIFLSKEISLLNNELVIFMHHPPALLNHKFMDREYPLQNIDKIQEVLLKSVKNMTIFCGHYHSEIDKQVCNQRIISTPSNVFQIDEDSEIFKIKSFNPGWRFIEFHKNGISTNSNYIELNRN